MKKLSETHKKNLSLSHKGILADWKHPAWKGEQASYRAVHQWVARKLGKPGTCEGCGRMGLSGNEIHWANISGQYLRLLYDWVRLCSRCHKRKDLADKKYNKLTKQYQ